MRDLRHVLPGLRRAASSQQPSAPIYARNMIRHADEWNMNEAQGISCSIRGLRESDYATIAGQTDPLIAYAHFIAVAPDLRRGGLARRLYEHFFSESRDRGCTSVEAITAPINTTSIAFHTRLGFELLPGTAWVDGVPLSMDHDGPGKHRVRMRRTL